MLLLVLSLVSIFIKIPVENIISFLPEVSPGYASTLDIAFKTLKESPKNLILGSGPATWGYQFSIYKPVGLNLTNFWQIRFTF